MIKPDPFEFRLDLATGVPVYRQIIDQVLLAVATGTLQSGHQLPTVRQVAVDLAINPNTVLRAYRELEIRGAISTQQGIGTFVTRQRAWKWIRQRETCGSAGWPRTVPHAQAPRGSRSPSCWRG